MSVRNFARTFVREANIPPAEFVEGARMDAARALLENSVSPLKSIAYECGFKDAGRMRSAFRRRLGVTPQHYRQSFGFSAPTTVTGNSGGPKTTLSYPST
ncbi:helix-turn-helix domain-containing protein [Paraburkholderia sp. DGU8]|uniref:helix-turn-helix domain-containing protein n=1 Tax=Paraburkholderia sp. DGU8 TaxID=3161997 RepID=UPI003466D3FB